MFSGVAVLYIYYLGCIPCFVSELLVPPLRHNYMTVCTLFLDQEIICYWPRKVGRDTDPSPLSEVTVRKASTLMKKHGFRERECKRRGDLIAKPKSTHKKESREIQ